MLVSNDQRMLDRRRTIDEDNIQDEADVIFVHLDDKSQTQNDARLTINNTHNRMTHLVVYPEHKTMTFNLWPSTP